jgi:hypothetical protein
MRQPSRSMPKYRKRPTSFRGWVFLIGFLLLLGWLVWSAPVILLVAPVLAFADYRNRKKSSAHLEALARARGQDSICTFSRRFARGQVDPWVIRAVYEQLQGYLASESERFPVRPTDDIFVDLRIDDEDFEMDIVEEITQRTGRTLAGAEKNRFYGRANIVENLVHFFNEQPKEREA